MADGTTDEELDIDAEAMRVVKASWHVWETGEKVEIQADLSALAIADLIRFMESADGMEVYESGDFVL